ncbi:MAG: 3-hydroxyacyl-CoA dehydrogenase family protein [Betaproteobacteria bacterium]|nr:3-hydroxyacyl-CoA dehydrogenase family protein [Betaproteobacteria bacterium]MDH5577113.1 3-hydroxyacyl-CoA dehydrogenase family protein [Betaproteobacteria bacterium]
MAYCVIDTGASRSFPAAHALTQGAAEDGEIVVVIGAEVKRGIARIKNPDTRTAVLLELGTECLGVYTGESRGTEGSNVLGFARFRLGDAAPTNLVELVRQPRTGPAALAAAQKLFEDAGLAVAVCNDFPGRIVDRLIRPYFNAALRRLDEGLASADDMDTTLKLGLGYPEGPIALLERTGLAAHFDVTQALYEALGDAAYAPARRARAAKQRG